MSGGFFRGTSADQDTRFSNKQAKLLKSQKFPPELDHLVDMTKVKMDVIRPWIATRVTELLGFDDEVLINFIFELLEGKEVDGKQIQIQLTGFMEKNTGKFMRELWGLLLSAQNNVSGVPQQFLDAKEEETRKNKEETDRIAGEIQKRRDRDGWEPERVRKSGFDGEADGSKFSKAPLDSVSKFSKPRESSMQPEEDRAVDGRHGSRIKNRISRSPTRSNNKAISRSRSHSKERQKSRSLSVSSQSPRLAVSSGQRDQSPEGRSVSPKRWCRSPPKSSLSSHRRHSPRHSGRSVSPKRWCKSPPKSSLSPHRRHSPRHARSPMRQRSPHFRRSPRLRRRSPPFRSRSPLARRRSPRRRSRSPLHRRSPSPLQRRSSSPRRWRSPTPLRRRSPPLRRRSPFRRRSPSPSRHCRSPLNVRRQSPSPVRRRSPIKDRSVSPARGRSPSPRRRRSPSLRSPKIHRRSPLHSPKSRTTDSPISPPQRKRSRNPYRSQSPVHRIRKSLSREHDVRENGNESRQYRDEQTPRRVDVKKSPINHDLERELAGRSGSKHKVPESISHKLPFPLRSSHRDMGNHSGNGKKMQVLSPENSLTQSDSLTDKRKVNPRTSKRSRSLSMSPFRQTNIRMPRHDSPATIKDKRQMTRAREVSCHRIESSRKRSKDLPRAVSPGLYSPDRREISHSPAASGRVFHPELKKKDVRQESDISLPERHAQQLPNSSEGIEYTLGRVRGEIGSQGHIHDGQRSAKQLRPDASSDKMEYNEQTINDEKRLRERGDEYSKLHRATESIKRSKNKMDKKGRLGTRDSDSEETNSYRNEYMEKRRHKKSDKRKRDYDESSESNSVIKEKKEAKRRRKDEKRLRKEEKRRRREERHLRKLERRAGKMKGKSIDTVLPPSDFDMDHTDAGDSDGDAGRRKNSHLNVAEEAETEQKKLEFELREKALESLRAKKAISH